MLSNIILQLLHRNISCQLTSYNVNYKWGQRIIWYLGVDSIYMDQIQ